MLASRNRRKILFVHNGPNRFVLIDREILKQRFDVTEWHQSSRFTNPFVLASAVKQTDLVFGWFASWHSFLPVLLAKVFGKPSLIIVGGYDLANMPDIGYGQQRGGVRRWVSRATMRLASGLITNSTFSQREAGTNVGIAPSKVSMIYHGLSDPYHELNTLSRAPVALTVGKVNQSNRWRKGHEPFVRTAHLLGNVQFVLVGRWEDDAIDYLRTIASPNILFAGELPEAELLAYYRHASVYVQASAHEGFGMSVAEAMLGGCIPVVTRAGALPEVVGATGVYIDSTRPEHVAKAIQVGLMATEAQRFAARERVLQHFSLEQRQEALLARARQFLDVTAK